MHIYIHTYIHTHMHTIWQGSGYGPTLDCFKNNIAGNIRKGKRHREDSPETIAQGPLPGEENDLSVFFLGIWEQLP